MSRLTGTDAYGLMEAYNNVYAPQELTEEQVWEEVETWVNSLLEEGYDLSEYTWEEMYESYIEEMGRAMTTGQMTAPKVAPTPTSRPQVAGGGMGGMRGSGRDRNATQTSSSPGALRVPPKVGPKIVGPAIVGPKIVGPGKVGPGASPRQQPASAPAARPSGGTPASPKVVPKPTATTTPSGGSALDQATAAASKPAAFSPKPQSDVGGMIARSQARQAAQTPKPATSTATAKPTPRQARLNMEMEYDTYDTVLEHLVSEGYADTEESALVIMANMSEEWKQSIVTA
jgi:hypothetical protein